MSNIAAAGTENPCFSAPDLDDIDRNIDSLDDGDEKAVTVRIERRIDGKLVSVGNLGEVSPGIC